MPEYWNKMYQRRSGARAVMSRDEHIAILEMATELVGAGIAVYSYDPRDGKIAVEYANDLLLERMKITKSQAFQSDSALFATNEPLRVALLERVAIGDTSPFELEVTDAAGEHYWVNVSCRLLGGDDRGRARFLTISRDITQERRDDAYRKLLALSVEKEPDAVLIVRMLSEKPMRPDIVYNNRAFRELSGYSKAEMADGVYPNVFGTKTDIKQVQYAIEAVQSGATILGEILLYRKDGTAFWAEYRAHPIDLPERHCVIIIRDITERREQETRIMLLSTAVEEASDFVILTDGTPDEEGGARIVYVNAAFTQVTGYTSAELLGKSYKTLYAEENSPELMAAITANVVAGRPNYCEALIKRKNAAPFWLEFVARPFAHPHDNSAFRITIGRDITLRRRAANQVALLLAGIEEENSRTVLYERDDTGALTVSYENTAASTHGRYRLLKLLNGNGREARDAREALDQGREYRAFFVDRNDEKSEVVEFTARPVRNPSGIEAVLTQEHIIVPDVGLDR